MRKIYLASSWRNPYQETVVKILREEGHDVYDFKNPAPGNKGFHWSEIDPNWRQWSPQQFKEALTHPIAANGHELDHKAMEWCDTGILLLPSGNSAHLEAGWISGKGKQVIVFAPDIREPELMYLSICPPEHFCVSINEVLDLLNQ